MKTQQEINKYLEAMLKKDWADKIISKYPAIFSEVKYIEAPEGWASIIDRLCCVVDLYVRSYVPEELRDQIFVKQIKEKFGTLRVYFSHTIPFIDGAIRMAEDFSGTICQWCGKVGEQHSINGWISTLCEEHYQQRLRQLSK